MGIKRILGTLLAATSLVAAGSSAFAYSCKDSTDQMREFNFSNVDLVACAESAKFMGEQGVKWAIKNRTNHQLEIKFNKTYTFSCGVTTTVPAHMYLKPDEFINGGFFSGDLDLGDPLFPNEKCGGTGNYLRRVEVTGMQVVDETAKENERLERERVEKERRERARAEEERKAKEAADQEKRERERAAAEEKREREERAARLREEEEQRRVEEIRHRNEEARRQELQYRAEQRRQDAESVKTASDETAKSVTDLGMSAMNQKVIFEGLTWHVKFGAGLRILGYPMYEDSSTEVGEDRYGYSQYDYSSDTGTGLGLGAKTSLEFWPLFGDYFGVGGFGSFFYGAAFSDTISSTVSELNYGTRAFAGFRYLAGLFEYSKLDRTGVTTTDMAAYGSDSTSSASSTSHISRLGYGVRIGNLLEHSDGTGGTALDLMILNDKVPDIYNGGSVPKTVQAKVYRAALNIDAFTIEGEYGPSYPVAGHPSYTPSGGGDKGTLWSIGFGFSFRFFGSPYFK